MNILLADDHDMMRAGVRRLLETREGWTVCAEARNGREAVARVAELSPEVAILDVTMPELNGLEATRRICGASAATGVIVYTMHAEEHVAREAVQAGALGFVLKSDAGEVLLEAVEAAGARKRFVTPRLADAVDGGRRRGPPAREARLTSREREVVQLLAEGKTNWCISVILGIGVKTVETHRANAMHKLGTDSVVELVRYAVRNRLIEP